MAEPAPDEHGSLWRWVVATALCLPVSVSATDPFSWTAIERQNGQWRLRDGYVGGTCIEVFGDKERPLLSLRVRQALPEAEYRRYVIWSTAGPVWNEFALPYFFEHQGKPHFCVRTWWGRRVIIDLSQAKQVTPAGLDARLTKIEIDTAMNLLREGPAVMNAEKVHLSAEFRLLAAVHVAGRLGVKQAVPLLQKIEAAPDKMAGWSSGGMLDNGLGPNEVDVHRHTWYPMRGAAQTALRQLGTRPAGHPTTTLERVSGGNVKPSQWATPRADRVSRLRAGMRPQEVADLLGPPDVIERLPDPVDVGWRYDIDREKPFTLLVLWKGRRVHALDTFTPPLWSLRGLTRGEPTFPLLNADGSIRDGGLLYSRAFAGERTSLDPPPVPPRGVRNVAELYDAAAQARPGQTILVEDGRYPLTRTLTLRADRVTLRGRSGDRAKVVLDGGGTLGEAVCVRAAADVAVADLTVQNVRWNAVKLDSETGVQRFQLYNCVLRDVWQRGVKGTAVPAADRERLRPRGCRVERCLFENTRPKRFADDPDDNPTTYNGDYVAGIDVMFPDRWVIADNEFRGLRGRTGQGRGAVFLWHDARHCVVENNRITDCDAGVCLGNAHKPPDVAVHADRCEVRDNTITNAPEGGVVAVYTEGCEVLGNTISEANSRRRRGVRVVHDADGLVVAGNRLRGVGVVVESTSRIIVNNNQ